MKKIFSDFAALVFCGSLFAAALPATTATAQNTPAAPTAQGAGAPVANPEGLWAATSEPYAIASPVPAGSAPAVAPTVVPIGPGTRHRFRRVGITTEALSGGTLITGPLPAGNTLSIESNSSSLWGSAALLTTVGGRVMHRFFLQEHQQLHMAYLPAGFYLLRLEDGTVVRIAKQ